MHKNFTQGHALKGFAIMAVIFVLSGCASKSDQGSIQVDPNIHTVSREELLDSDTITLPMNYSEDHYRKLVLAVSFHDIGEETGGISPEIVQTVSARLQTEMTKLKRFTIYSLHNRGGVRVLQNLSQIGEANINVPEGQELPEIDLVLSGAIVATKEMQDRSDRTELIYEVDCDFSCEELATRTVKFAEKAKGRVIRTQFFSLSGKKLGGYREEDERQAIYAAAMKALIVLANKLGNTYPVGGRVTGVLGDRMTLDCGYEHGISQANQMVVYAKIQGVDLPLALAEASPGSNTSSLLIYKWNNDDSYAKDVIESLRSDVNWHRNNLLYAVSAGMSVPPEWDREYGDN